MDVPQYISHLRKTDEMLNEWIFQSNEEHSNGVAKLASNYANKIGFGNWGFILGLLHDKGKEQNDFQRYIRKVSGYMPEIKDSRRTPHAYVGALMARQLYPQLYPLLSMPIMAHHAGLYDYTDFLERMKAEMPSDIRSGNSIKLEIPKDKEYKSQDFQHLVRVLYSCLVDADFLNTEEFMQKSRAKLRKKQKSIKELLPLLENHLNVISESSEKNELNALRSSIQKLCKDASIDYPGFYSLTVPTGGGKTLSSLLWAMLHAVKYDKDRIIIVIPYTSIIVQTAAILRNIFGVENVLEHHSVFDSELIFKESTEETCEIKLRQLLATENWDYPIVVTTNVQLFQSMFSNKPSQCRKLHNVCNSVLVLDEVQMLPMEHLQPIVDGLSTYQRIFNTSVLFTTASQPVLSGEHEGCNPRVRLKGLTEVKEIIPKGMNLHDKLRRVNLHIDKHPVDYDELVARLLRYDKVLCIVNTRREAQEIYSRLPKNENVFHLSRMMCSAHIQKVIAEIKDAFKNTQIKTVRVVATQLIEAGVDIDFPIVFRQEAGLDSVLQAAGRCNREGKLGISDAYVFSFNHPLPQGCLSKGSSTLKNMLKVADWFAPETMKDYFIRLYRQCETFDKVEINDRMKPEEWYFETVSKDFRLIDNNGVNVIVNYEKSMELIHELKANGISYGLMKQLGRYMVNLREHDFKKLMKEHLLDKVMEGVYVLSDREQYDVNTGLVTKNHWLEEILIK